jgi:hypothetical protein
LLKKFATTNLIFGTETYQARRYLHYSLPGSDSQLVLRYAFAIACKANLEFTEILERPLRLKLTESNFHNFEYGLADIGGYDF